MSTNVVGVKLQSSGWCGSNRSSSGGSIDSNALAAGAGTASAFESIDPPELLLFEPHQPELCNFTPTTFVDITPVIEQKRAAMAEMQAQAHLHAYYGELA